MKQFFVRLNTLLICISVLMSTALLVDTLYRNTSQHDDMIRIGSIAFGFLFVVLLISATTSWLFGAGFRIHFRLRS